MPSPRETILEALHRALLKLNVSALRGQSLPERVPDTGLLILRDGDPGRPEVTLSPLRYHWQHQAEIEAVVQGDDRDALFDALITKIGSLVAADRTLGGLCDWVESEAPRSVDRINWDVSAYADEIFNCPLLDLFPGSYLFGRFVSPVVDGNFVNIQGKRLADHSRWRFFHTQQNPSARLVTMQILTGK